ncbi:MAG: AtpZ/AtpI family protein [Flavicella sp.]
MKNKKLPIKPLHKFLRLSGVGVQMGVTIYIASYFGKKLDIYFGFEKLCTLLAILLAFLASVYSLMQQLKKIQD